MNRTVQRKTDNGVSFGLALFGGGLFAAIAILPAGAGDAKIAIGAGVAAAMAIALLSPGRLTGAALRHAFFDALVVGSYAYLCNPAGVLWQAPVFWKDLFAFTSVGAGCATALYIGVFFLIASYTRHRPTLPAALAVALIPYLFCAFVSLGSPLPLALGRLLMFGAPIDPVSAAFLGRALVLILLNEAIVAGAAIALGRHMPREGAVHGALWGAAIFAAATPVIASLGSSVYVAELPSGLAVIVMALTAALAQAGLWGETYLVTQTIANLLHGAPPIGAAVRKPWKTGIEKGFVYGFVFMGLVAVVGALLAQPNVRAVLEIGGLGALVLLGAVIYPLGRTILESTDSTPPFFRRLGQALRNPHNYLRGLVLGAAIGIGLSMSEAGWSGGERFLFGAATGALVYAGVDFLSDIVPLLTRTRRRLSSWRVYLFGALLGGIVGGAVSWYLDAHQLTVIGAKFTAYTYAYYPAFGKPIADYNIFPLFSKWGVTNLGKVEGGVKLFYTESLSGVIQWIFAAPLFSINLFFLTALVKRDMKPLRALFSEAGVRQLIDNAIMVLRWGLWMAPVIYSFLKAAPDPTWYNQDGLIRTGVASFMAAISPYPAFATWSLEIFTALLAYDWLRVLIWFDHMGLRVATLVNLSFVGGDVADEKAARFLGKAQVSRAAPEGVRRFGTWAPLLLPFYIPASGVPWDTAWVGAEKLRGATPPAMNLLIGYLIVVGVAALALAASALRRMSVASQSREEGTGVAAVAGAKPFILTNGLLTSEWYDDGQSASRVESAARIGPPIDTVRRPDDPAQPRGKFLYFREGDGELWSLGAAPVFGTGETHLQRISPTQLFLSHTRNGLRAEATVEVVEGEAVEITRLKLVNLERRPRRIIVASLREWVINETGVERRDAAYNAIHVGTWFMQEPAAIIAQNRLLKTPGSRHSKRRLSPEVAFHAAGVGATGEIKLLGYEDVKSRFFGMASVSDPDSLMFATAPREKSDEGLLYGFEPCASLRYEARIAPESTTEIVFVDGWARDFATAVETIARRLDVPTPETSAIEEIQAKRRRLLSAPSLADAALAGTPARAEFIDNGRKLITKPGTPRPYAHVIANAFGEGAVLTNDGDIFSFSVNARQNSLTPFRMGEGRAGPLGQTIYVRDLASGDVDCATYLPLRRDDGAYDVTFGLGYGVYSRRRADLEIELTIFNPHGKTCEVKLLRIVNKGASDRMFAVSQIAEMVLAETPIESQNGLQTERDLDGHALFFHNPKNDFVRGWAFAATSLNTDFMETSRRRAFGPRANPRALPYMVEHGHPDAGSAGDQRYVAAFSGAIEVKAGGEALVSFVLGQTGSLEDARRFAKATRTPDWGRRAFAEMQASWDDILGVLRIETNKPEFDRLINDWLPYQLLAARLWGRTGPVQRSGATGYRDQLQDVLPLILLAPELARRQILLHAARQFIEGDAVKWWHTAPGGGTGLADRTRSSDPHLWLPYVTLRYVEATGDEAAFDVEAPFIEGDPVPSGQEGQANVPLPSRESATLFNHCRLAVDWTINRFGAHGLPLMGTGDWDDGMDLVGFDGRGESVWVGFFLHGILMDFAPVCDRRGRRRDAERYRACAERLRLALDACWRGDRYLRAYADDGREIAPMSAMTSSWPVLSRAVNFSRGVEVVEQALAVLGRPDRVLLVSPAYTEHSDPFPGRSAEYPPGVRENGGQYSHGSSWFVDALAQLAENAAKKGDEKEAQRLFARAFETWIAISPLSKYGDASLADIYGLPPHQQPADVYEGMGYEGRGGWSWYTGSAARMLVAAYSMLGLKLERGEFSLRLDAFDPKGDLTLRKVVYRGQVYESVAKTASSSGGDGLA